MIDLFLPLDFESDGCTMYPWLARVLGGERYQEMWYSREQAV
jgi:hypothetical protein